MEVKLKLIKEKLKNFMAHYSETKAEDFLNEMSKAFQKEKANSEGKEESLTKVLIDIENDLKFIEEQINLTFTTMSLFPLILLNF